MILVVFITTEGFFALVRFWLLQQHYFTVIGAELIRTVQCDEDSSVFISKRIKDIFFCKVQ